MSKKLENFIQENREAFDTVQPSEALWQRIDKKLDGKKDTDQAKLASLKPWLKVAAAIALIFSIAAVCYTLMKKGKPTEDIAGAPIQVPAADSNTPLKHDQEQAIVTDPVPEQDVAIRPKEQPAATVPTGIHEEELYHYTRLIEIKQGQMKELKKTEPELYNAFSKDMEMLETSFLALKAQLKMGVNGEKLLEAMIGNLKMQSDLLNKQLTILKEVHSKKNQHGKDYKSL